MAKKRFKIRDKQGNPVDYDISAASVTIDVEGKSLEVKLSELVDAISRSVKSITFNGNSPTMDSNGNVNLGQQMQGDWTEANINWPSYIKNKPSFSRVATTGSYNDLSDKPTIPEGVATDSQMSDSSDAPVKNKVIKAYVDNLISGLINGAPQALDTLNELSAALGNDANFAATITQQLANKANSADVYTKSQTYSKGEVDTALSGKLGVNDVSAQTPTTPDGTFTIHVGDTDYTINLNHTHENMAKLIVCEESDLPSTLDPATIYAQVDDAADPTEIQSLWIAGLEFVGGGGATDDTPRLIRPLDGLTLDFDGQSSIQLPVRGKNLIADLSLTVTGDFTVTDGNNAAVSTITATAANNGVVLRLTKGSNYNSGTLRIFSSEVDVTVTLNRDISLPAGYSPLEAVSPHSTILSLADTNIPIYSSWRLVLRSNDSSTSQVAICQKISSVGRYFGTTANGKWGVAPAAAIDGVSVTAKTEALVEFGASLSKLTIGGNSITVPPQQSAGNYMELFGCSVGENYYFKGYVYEIECVSGGLFHAFPAKRLSDNAVGLYDIENDVFYTGFSS